MAGPTEAGPAPRPLAAPHSLVDDLQAGITAVVLVSLGLALLDSAGLATGGAPGLGILLGRLTGWPLGLALFVVNIPFYLLGWWQMGPRFTLRTVAAVAGLSIGVELVRQVLAVRAEPMYAAVAGGLLIGTGLLVMFRHGASFGGINILALFLQRRAGWAAGRVQLALDVAILGASFAVLEPRQAAWSLLAAAAINAVLIWNHRPGRYTATP